MTDKIDKEIDRLFTQELLPLAARAKGSGTELLQTRLASETPSYYVRRRRPSMSKKDFEVGGCTSPATVERDLQALWADDPEIGLAALAPPMAKLALALREVEEEADDVSNFIYVMY